MDGEGKPMRKDQINGTGDREVIPEFLDENMGIPVMLIDAAYKVKDGDATGVVVPDVAGLEAAMAVARVMDDFKLSGKDFKFLRKAIGMKANGLAEFLGIQPETLSRWENGREPIATNAERVMRLRTFHALNDKAPGVKASLDAILEMKFKPIRVAGNGTMKFKRFPVVKDGTVETFWVHEGFHTQSAQVVRLRA
jgi:DNA-binding transcriptional regulator YiaG